MTQLLVNGGYFSGNLLRLKPHYRDDGTLAPAAEIGAQSGIQVKTMSVTPRENRLRFIFDRSLDAGIFVGKFLLLAIVIEAVIVTLVPISWITVLVGKKNVTSIFMAAVIGLPLPLNQIPAIPILAGLLQKGIDHGAALTFLMAGPVSSLPAMIALTGMFRPRVVVGFLLTTLGLSMLLGLVYQLIV